ncbi:class I SAM-dependent methyltransferase [candidate division KSB1 bacterium]|nr:class I SAM-dependent methyltransferase [candidate division KSB1 bacterium]
MKIQKYLANQLRCPHGFVGRFIIGRLWNKRNAALNNLTLSQLQLGVDDRVLDIGFGGGYLLDRIIPQVKAGFAAGIDISPVMIKNGRKRWRRAIRAGQVDITCGRAENLPYPDRHFNKVCSVNSIFYWNDPQQGIAEIYSVLENNGRLVLTFTCEKDLQNKPFTQYGIKTFKETEGRSFLIHAGFRDIKMIREQDQYRDFICITGYK